MFCRHSKWHSWGSCRVTCWCVHFCLNVLPPRWTSARVWLCASGSLFGSENLRLVWICEAVLPGSFNSVFPGTSSIADQGASGEPSHSLAAQESVLITQMFQQDKHLFPLRFLVEAVAFPFTLTAMPPLFPWICLESCFVFICVTLIHNSSRAVLQEAVQVCGREIRGKMLNTETALAQEIPELQIAVDSVAARVLERSIIYACSAFILSLGTCSWSLLKAGCCATRVSGLGAVALWSVISAAKIPLVSSHHIQVNFKAKHEEGKATIQKRIVRKTQM